MAARAGKRVAALGVAVALLAGGCGDTTAAKSTRLVDPNKPLPLVSSLEIEPTSGDFLMTTNKGMWRIDEQTAKLTPLKPVLREGETVEELGTYLELVFVGDRELLGSGHPEVEPGLELRSLGLMQSDDGGLTWRYFTPTQETDLHKMILRGDRFYAWDSVRGLMILSNDRGLNYESFPAPRGQFADFVVDPADDDHLLFTTDAELYESVDGGRSWRPIANADDARLSWPASGELIRADADGTVYSGSDSGADWQPIGELDGAPVRFKETDDPANRFVALDDGTILATMDGGATWESRFRP